MSDINLQSFKVLHPDSKICMVIVLDVGKSRMSARNELQEMVDRFYKGLHVDFGSRSHLVSSLVDKDVPK